MRSENRSNPNHKPMKNRLQWTLAVATSTFTMLADAAQISAKLTVPMQINGVVNETGCNNSKGPQVTLEGEIVLGGVQVELIFQNNAKGTHQASAMWGTNVVLVP